MKLTVLAILLVLAGMIAITIDHYREPTYTECMLHTLRGVEVTQRTILLAHEVCQDCPVRK